uniref:Lipocalin 24 n=1 Tax=Rhipicephalus microplus TaxID=6941 RepID=A0A034WXA3_RHIMP
MHSLNFSLAVAIACVAFVVTPASSRAPHKLERNVTDTFELFDKFPYVVLVYSSGEDPEFQCLTNKRTELDMQAKKAPYVWIFKGGNGRTRKNVALHLSAGDAPDRAVFTLDDDTKNTKVAHFVYTDYKDCVIVEIPYDGDQCQLWVSKEVEDDVPQHCLDHLEDICDVTEEEYSKELCQNQVDDI